METPQNFEARSRRKTFMVLTTILLAILACILVALIYVFVSSSRKPSQNNSAEFNQSDQQSQENVASTYNFEGEYIKAALPTGWLIKEYNDVSGMNLHMDNLEYSGLTGLDVLDQNGVVIFSLNGIDGIGGGGGCLEIGVFEDTQSSYVEGIQIETEELGIGVTQQKDLTGVDYSSILFLGEKFRRVGTDLYTADKSDDVFNTFCGIKADFIQVEGLSFSVEQPEPSYTSNVYHFEISKDVALSDATLTELDSVLNSFETN